MPRRERQPALRAWRLVFVATAAASRTAGTWPLGTGSSSSSNSCNKQASPTPFLTAAEAAAAPSPHTQRPRSLISGRRRGSGRHNHREGGGETCDGGGVVSGEQQPQHQQHQQHQQFVPLWVRARGGAVGKRASGGRSPLSGDKAAAAAAAAQEEEDDGLEPAEEEQGEAEDDSEADEVETATEDEDEPKEDGSDPAGAGATAPAAAAPATGGADSVLDTLDLKTVLPQAIKTGVFFVLARWLGKKLTPTVESHVRTARAIYTGYLIFSQALCMYIRYLIWRKNDDTEMEVPPPAQLKNLMEAGKAGKAAEGAPGAPAAGTGAGAGAADAAGGLGGAASSLGPMLDKMMTSKVKAKKYDMKMIQGVRKGQFWAALIMCYTHLRRGMIKPMMLQVSFGVLSLLDNPLFHIYVLGREAKGNLARPFKKQGLMATLSGPMEAMSAKAEEAKAAMAAAEARAEARAAEAAPAAEEGEANEAAGEEHDDDDDDDDVDMPGIEALSESEADESE